MTREERYMTKVAKVICSRGAGVEQVAEKKGGGSWFQRDTQVLHICQIYIIHPFERLTYT